MDKFSRESSLEYESKNVANTFNNKLNGNRRASAARAFKPYGLRVGVMLFCLTVGPFLVSTFVNGINSSKALTTRSPCQEYGLLLTAARTGNDLDDRGRIDAERI
jgi:hypothetical protein